MGFGWVVDMVGLGGLVWCREGNGRREEGKCGHELSLGVCARTVLMCNSERVSIIFILSVSRYLRGLRRGRSVMYYTVP